MKRNNELVYWVRKAHAQNIKEDRELLRNTTRSSKFDWRFLSILRDSVVLHEERRYFINMLEEMTGLKFTNRKDGKLRCFYVHKD